MNKSCYGKWSVDESGLPCFNLETGKVPDPDAPLEHLISTGAMTAFVNRCGDLRLMTCAGGDGQHLLRPSPWLCLSDLFLFIDVDEEYNSLVPGEMDDGLEIRYGTGYARFNGDFTRPSLSLHLTQEFIAPWNDSPGIAGVFTVMNTGKKNLKGRLRIGSQTAPLGVNPEEAVIKMPFEGGDGWVSADAAFPSLGKVMLAGPDGWKPSREYLSIVISRQIALKPGASLRILAWIGCTLKEKPLPHERIRKWLKDFSPKKELNAWSRRLAPVSLPAPAKWIREECLWTAGQLLAFTGYDGSREVKIIHLGGYAWNGFPVRECAETAMVLAPWNSELACQSMVWLAKNQWPSGDLPKGYNFDGKLEKTRHPKESDNEIWFLLAFSEILEDGIPESFLDMQQPYADGTGDSMWGHAKSAWKWLRDSVGTGPHGLVRIWHGDWDDYMNGMGKLGIGESVMNTGMACRTADGLASIARRRGEDSLAKELEAWSASLRKSMLNVFDGTHFLRGFTDQGKPVGSRAEGRIHLNAQTWAALGLCGTEKMRRTALKTALRECRSPIGLTLISRPYPAPPPSEISWAPIPAGEGENAGIWPQTVHWTIWALAENGMLKEARRVWIAMSLRNHSALHPDVPYGIWNGPDCFSSHHAGRREGRTQVRITDRARAGVPQNPSVAWQPFSWRKIVQAEK